MKAGRNRVSAVFILFRRFSAWYPPTRFAFYPLYRLMRQRWGLPCVAAYSAVWITSGFLHGGVLLMFGHIVAAVVFTLIFVGLGLSGSLAILMKNRQRKLWLARSSGRCVDQPTAEDRCRQQPPALGG